MTVDFLGLQAFLRIAEHGSFQRAAASINLSPTALSHRLRKLEDDLGVQLVARTTRRVTLTPEGSEFLVKARRILGELEQSYEELKEAGKTVQDQVAFGCLPTLALSLAPAAIKEFGLQFPTVKVAMADGPAPGLVELIQSGAIEFALTMGTAMEPNLELRPIRKVGLAVFCPTDHPFARRASVGVEDLEDQPLIHLGPRDGTRLQVEQAFGSRANRLRWVSEVRQVVTAMRLVATGVGLTMAPSFAADPERDADVVPVPLTRPRLTDTVGILTRRDTLLSPAARSLVEIIHRMVRERTAPKTRKTARKAARK